MFCDQLWNHPDFKIWGLIGGAVGKGLSLQQLRLGLSFPESTWEAYSVEFVCNTKSGKVERAASLGFPGYLL